MSACVGGAFFIPVAPHQYNPHSCSFVYNCLGKPRIKKIYSKLYRGKTFHQGGRGKQVIEHYLFNRQIFYPCPEK